LPPTEQVEPLEDWKTGADESQKLLIEYDEGFEFDLLLPAATGLPQQAPGFDGGDQQSLLGKAVAHLGNRGRVLDML
jgi:hypothetical protein